MTTAMTYTEHVLCCTGCGLPIDECPGSANDWKELGAVVFCQNYDGNGPLFGCPGHFVHYRIFCTHCQKEGKHATPQNR